MNQESRIKKIKKNHNSLFLIHNSGKSRGFTLMELLIVISLLGILLLFLFWVYPKQIGKANDAKRKEDLDRLRISLQEFYNDNYCFPKELKCGESFSPYLDVVPCDPKTGDYRYVPQPSVDCPQWFKIYTTLEYEEDPVIASIGCKDGCGPEDEELVYNYGVSSTNVEIGSSFAAGSPLPSACPVITGCFEGICNFTDTEKCPAVYFCNDNCSGGCYDCPAGGCQASPNPLGVPGDAIIIEEKKCQ